MSDYEIINSEAVRLAAAYNLERDARGVCIPRLNQEEVVRRLRHEVKKIYEYKLTAYLLGTKSEGDAATERMKPLHSLFGIYICLLDSEIIAVWNKLRPQRLTEYTRIAREWKGNQSALELAGAIQEIEKSGPLKRRLDRVSVLTKFFSMWAAGEIQPIVSKEGSLPVSEYTPEIEQKHNLVGRVLERECFRAIHHGCDICPSCDNLSWYK